MKSLFKFFFTTIIIGIGVIFYYNSPPLSMKPKFITVRSGETIRNVSLRLEQEGLITNRHFFRLASHFIHNKTIRAGKYRMYAKMTSIEILRKLSRGDILAKKITIPEGFNLFQIADRLDAEGISVSGNFLYFAFNRDFLESIGIRSASAEGYIFPDTYNFPLESDPRDIITTMHKTMDRVLEIIDPSLKKMDRETHEILILASLIELEARIQKERPYISSVFKNRIQRGMRLDCDPTVRYAVKKFKGRLSYSDLADNSPYNTYVHNGLPPTPICSPGKASLQAAMNPKKTNYLYFVARNNGSHFFSKTYREHSRAVDYYQKNINNGFRDRQKL